MGARRKRGRSPREIDRARLTRDKDLRGPVDLGRTEWVQERTLMLRLSF